MAMTAARGRTMELGQLLLDLTARVRPERADGLTAAVVLATAEERWTLRLDRGRLTVGIGGVELVRHLRRKEHA